jgi:hypothetical protein
MSKTRWKSSACFVRATRWHHGVRTLAMFPPASFSRILSCHFFSYPWVTFLENTQPSGSMCLVRDLLLNLQIPTSASYVFAFPKSHLTLRGYPPVVEHNVSKTAASRSPCILFRDLNQTSRGAKSMFSHFRIYSNLNGTEIECCTSYLAENPTLKNTTTKPTCPASEPGIDFENHDVQNPCPTSSRFRIYI